MSTSILKYLPEKRAKTKLVQGWINEDLYEITLKNKDKQNITWKDLIEALFRAYNEERSNTPETDSKAES